MVAATLLVAAGVYHTCANYYGNLKCWGGNSNGQLGYNHTTAVFSPANVGFVPLGGNVTAITAGFSHSCALLSGGNLKCWGANSNGQLGYNHTNDILSPADVDFVPVGGNVTAVIAGAYHNCALLSSGDVKCWGINFYSMLGYNHTDNVISPANVGYVPLGGSARALAAGSTHTCAVLTSGNVKCWGDNTHAQLGYNHTNEVMSPADVGFLPVGGNVTAISAGYTHTCAVLSSGNMKCWGGNSVGQLGYGNTNLVMYLANVGFVSVGFFVTAIATGGYFTCALGTNENIKCWGNNAKGQLGYGNLNTVLAPTSVGVLPIDDVGVIAAGYWHMCAVRVQGSIVCWGSNENGQLGYNNDPSNILSPAEVGDIQLVLPSTSPTASTSVSISPSASISTSVTSTSSAAATASTSVSINPSASISASVTSTSSPSPAASTSVSINPSASISASSPASVTSTSSAAATASTSSSPSPVHLPTYKIAAGFSNTCATVCGNLKCWGANDNGTLGYNHTNTILTPAGADFVPVSGYIIETAVGGGHTCAVAFDGGLKCWGNGWAGQLGYGDNADVRSPADVPTVPLGEAVVAAAAGDSHTCALLSSGTMKCWGNNVAGQLGYNNTDNINSPTGIGAVPVGDAVTSIAAGTGYTCAVLSSGGMKCWGNNSVGQLGYGHTNDVLSPADTDVVPVGENVTAIAAGMLHTCALLASGNVKCWGGGTFGQLGYQNTNSVLSPASVGFVSVGGPAAAVTAGGFHTCALLTSGAVKCWGDNSFGQLGYNNTQLVVSPGSIGYLPIGDTATAISAGRSHTCSVLQAGAFRCWGQNNNGQLGYNNTFPELSPASVGNVPFFLPAASPPPIPCASSPPPRTSSTARALNSATMISIGYYHTCAVIDRMLTCWGLNDHGQLGYDHQINVLVPAPPGLVPVGHDVSGISAGSSHTCVIVAVGTVKCWGSDYWGQLGYGAGNYMVSSQEVTFVPTIDNVSAIACGNFHTCVLLASGNVKCWGNAWFGQLGYNSTDPVFSPREVGYVEVGANVTAIATGAFHTCALASDDSIKCWGSNTHGTLGYNHTDDILSPQMVGPVPVGGLVRAISAGGQHTCALLSNGDVKCWGNNANGQLGYGDMNNVLCPADQGSVSLGAPAIAVAAGAAHTCALLFTGAVKCWGLNDEGQLGYNHTITLLSPPADAVNISATVASLAAGVSHTCALLSYGGVRCWGGNAQGQLGYNNTISAPSPPSGGDVALVAPSASISSTRSTSPSPTRSTSPSPTRSASSFATPTGTVSRSLFPTWSVKLSATSSASLLSTISGTISATPISSISTSPSRTLVTSSTSTPSSPAARVQASTVPHARIPILQIMVLAVRSYISESSVTSWMHGGGVPPQLSLSTLWQEGLSSNATVADDGADPVVLSDVLPPIMVLLKATGEVQDYAGIRCTLDAGIREFTDWAQTRVHARPSSLFSGVVQRDATQHYHAFLLSGERSLLAAGGRFHQLTGSFQCSPTFPPSLYVSQNSVMTVPIFLRPALWAIPRGAVVSSSFLLRSVGMPPPACFELKRNASEHNNEPLWHTCTDSEFAEYTQGVHIRQLEHSWSPSYLDLNGASEITFSFQLTHSMPAALLPNISIMIGNASCHILDRMLVEDILFVRCTSPTYEAGCLRLSGTTGCAPQSLSVQLGDPLDLKMVETVLHNTSTPLHTRLRCNPFCDLLGTATNVRMVVRDTGVAIASHDSAMYDTLMFYGDVRMALAVFLDGSKLQRRPPITYFDICLGYTDPLRGDCSNASLMHSLNCAFGSGSDCRPCPRGALCPGGYRAMPVAGFWAASISTASIVECAPPADRCLGWDSAANVAMCSEGYDARSPGCGWCADGYFKTRGGSKCARCPSTDDTSMIVLPILLLVAVVVGIVCAFMVVVWAVAKVFGGTIQGGIRRVVEFASAVFQSIQLVSTVTSAAGNALPALMQPVANVLNALQIQGILVDEACLKHQDPYIRVYVLSGLALLLASILLIQSLGMLKMNNRCQHAGSKLLALFFACYGLVAQAVTSAYQCMRSAIPLRSAFPILMREFDGGQHVLAANGIHESMKALATCDANEFSDGCAEITGTLAGEVELIVTSAYGRTDICGGTAHMPVIAIATAAFMLALLSVPLALLMRWRRRVAGIALVKAEHSDIKTARSIMDRLPDGLPLPRPAIDNRTDSANPFDLFLQNQRYMEAKAYWWQLDCLLLLTIAAVVHTVGKPSTLIGIWLQAAGICGACAAAMIGKIVTKPYKPENFHLFVTATGIQAYSMLIQVLMAVSYSADLATDVDGYRAALTPVSILCLLGAVSLLIAVSSAFLYSLVGGAIKEQRDERLRREASRRQHQGMTVNPLLAFKPSAAPSKRVVVDCDIEGNLYGSPQLHAGVKRVHATATQEDGRRQARESVARHLAPVQLRRANRSASKGHSKPATNDFDPT